ncbi:aminoglycoside phosphotransferase family protein [Sutcliffiella rhizosphaerae]|uniref:Aminoglycoside phosphotransferase domain-containing protein n=1 Tax=Sutcliffiella rhizosphaerae TaxID=2880967 RepID=A0ABM8YNP6_9BACI|nr:phosphotransferase [Sutcliffiella rhizosphaerae]CAG9621606.1 hypothetical protein BACCIP111883_02379 [Sutcliffiella rhizosphaerae]
MNLERISLFDDAKMIVELHKGLSTDKKYQVDEKFLVRVFPFEDVDKRRKEFEVVKELSRLSEYVPEAVKFEVVKKENLAYMVLGFLPGKDGEEALVNESERQQYLIGFKAGQELKKLHKLQAPDGYESWYSLKKRKSDKYLDELHNVSGVDMAVVEILETYIRENEHLMSGRPNRFQHDDFHPNNLIVQNGEFAGFIDFQRMDWGDPIHDLQKLGFFAIKVSVPFSIGAIDGYHDGNEVPSEFWRLFSLYSAMHAVSGIVWGKKMGDKQFNLLLKYALDVLKDHDDFKEMIPIWYKREF